MFVTQLKSFFWVARLGSITQAARQLGLSQPTVTAQIKALEEMYEVELFTRQSGRLAISDAGLKLLPQIEQLLLQTAQIESSMRQSGTVQQGQLRIGATAPYYVLDIVRRYQAALPLVDISIQSGNSRRPSIRWIWPPPLTWTPTRACCASSWDAPPWPWSCT